MEAAMQNLREAQQNLQSANTDKGGHRERALEYINRAIAETQAGMQYANQH
jgi:F0F1-type ATP synthase epsilon subunit